MADAKKVEANLVPIKPQFVYKEPEEGESPDKKARLEEEGQRVRRLPTYENLCRVVADVPPDEAMHVCSTTRCRYVHDVAKYLQTKAPDIGPECYVYKLKGHCPRGVMCRFGSQHITESGRNKVDLETQKNYEANGPKTIQFSSRETEAELRKRAYNFRRSEEILNTLPKPSAPAWMAPAYQGDIDFTEDVDVTSETPVMNPRPNDNRLGPFPDDEAFQRHVDEKKRLDWRDKLFLPAHPHFGNLPYRRICREFGAEITCSEPLIASNLLEGSLFDWLLARRHESEETFGIQLFGNSPFVLTRAAQLIDEKTNADFIDLRYGNPGEHIRYQSKGSMSPYVLQCVARVTSLPLTVCSRLGEFRDLLPTYKACGISLITMSGRNKENRDVDWNGVTKAASELSPIPVMVCSDAFSHTEYFELKKTHPQLTGVVVSRGALVKPWLFTEIKQKRAWDISSSERFDILQRFVNYGLDNWGSDAKGVEVTRRFLLDWLSLLCRYIPIGLLERPPQKLNDRCAKFIGRDDMETLLGSQEHEDWLKISEMLLGPVPEGFQFSPKIRPGNWPIDT